MKKIVRNKYLNFRVTEREFKLFNDVCQQKQLGKSELFRRLLERLEQENKPL